MINKQKKLNKDQAIDSKYGTRGTDKKGKVKQGISKNSTGKNTLKKGHQNKSVELNKKVNFAADCTVLARDCIFLL